MKKQINYWQSGGFIFVSALGTLLHFLYDWLSEAIWIAPFSGVNESTCEHIKLFFWPAFIFAIIQSFFFKDRQDFWCIKRRGILLGMIMIPTLFYTLNGVIGTLPSWVNISIFFISAAIAYIYESRLFNAENIICKNQKINIAILCIIALLFVIFTFTPPELEIFRDPLTGTYGI